MRNFLISRLFNVLGMLAAMSLASTPTVCAHVDNALPAPELAPPCPRAQRQGPAVTLDPVLYKEGHPGTRVRDYGVRVVPDEQPPPGVECRVPHATAPMAQSMAHPPPRHDTRIPP